MLLLRNLAYWLLMAVFTLLFFPVVLCSLLLPMGINKTTTAWALVLLWLLEHVAGMKYRIVGAENIPAGPAIICCKHQSGWETLATQKLFPLQVFVAKRELFKIPFFGWGLKLTRTIGIDRGNPQKAAQQMLEQGSQRKAEGLWITVFPEGTRIKPGYRGRYKSGAARMAQLLEMDLVPVAHNSGEFWPKNSFLKYPGTVTVVIGAPIAHDSGSVEELTERCETWIENRQAEIQGQGPFGPQNPVLPTPTIRARDAD